MATDYAEKEREFLSDLKAGTGKDLAEWMGAISAQGFKDKNQVIDWLREQGFMFWKASWLERIHNNGGRPIYADANSARANAEVARAILEASEALAETATASQPAASARQQSLPAKAPQAPSAAAAGEAVEIAALLAKAKGYRPLAEHLLRTIRAQVPAVRFGAAGNVILMSDGADFAALLIGGRELRLGLALGERAVEAPWARARIPGAPPSITHVLVLADARQVTAELQQLVRAAHAAIVR